VAGAYVCGVSQASPHSPCPAVFIDRARVCVVCVTVLELRGRKRWSSEWHLRAMWSRFLSRSPVHQTQHVHDSRRLMTRWCFAGTYSPTSGATACTNCVAGKYSAAAGASSAATCVDCSAGNYSNATGVSACLLCGVGKYHDGSLTLVVAQGLVGLSSSIASSTLEAWTAAGIREWKMGSNGQSCSTVCTNAGSSYMCGNFPLQLSQDDTNALFASLGWSCSSTSSTSDDRAPFYYSNTCYRGSGTSSCSSSSSSYYRLCACGSVAVAPGLIGLSSSIASSTLEAWTAAGVREWKKGGNGQSCHTVCSNAGLSCGSFPQQLSKADTNALFASLGWSCGSTSDASDNSAPFMYGNGYGNCYRGSGTSSCSGSFSVYERLCPCGPAMVTYVTSMVLMSYEYRTLDGTSPTSTSIGCQSCVCPQCANCFLSYMALPAGGWVLSPDDAAAVAVATAYPWGTDSLVFANGNSIHGPSRTGWQGVQAGSGKLLQSGNQYAVNGCDRRILIRRQIFPAESGIVRGATACYDCVAGTYSAAGASVCTDCAAGTYSLAGTALCTNCAAGKYSMLSGAASETMCLDCMPGTYSSVVGASNYIWCISCPAGKYSSQIGAGSPGTCENCPTGTYSVTLGATMNSTCVRCVAGKYSDTLGASSDETCQDCGAGTYSAAGASVCTDCEAGKFSAAIGATTVDTCLDFLDSVCRIVLSPRPACFLSPPLASPGSYHPLPIPSLPFSALPSSFLHSPRFASPRLSPSLPSLSSSLSSSPSLFRG
jgi:hypothetical protein